MANMKTKKPTRSKAGQEPPPSSLVLDLHAPGMTLMHRAGLGGLAATLRAMERRHGREQLRDRDLPQGPDLGDGYPWLIEPTHITLDWGEPTAAGDYLRKLFTFGFGIKDTLIDLPGTYRTELNRAVRAELQLGLTRTFLQFGPHRDLGSETSIFYDPDSDGVSAVRVQMQPCYSYLHQNAWEKWTDEQGCLKQQPLSAPSAFNPGAVARHNAFKAATEIREPASKILCTCFAMIGCISLPIRQSAGVLLVPEVSDIATFAWVRPHLTPANPRYCRVSGASDAALQAMMRLRAKRLMSQNSVRSTDAMRLQPIPWNTKQKSRISAATISPGQDIALRQFDTALRHLPPRLRVRERSVRQKRKVIAVESEWFWIDSVIRPLIADNLARNRRWYDGFTMLMRDREARKSVRYETKGLQSMMQEDELFGYRGEKNVVRAVHTALGRRYGEIAEQYKHNPTGRDKKWETEYNLWRLAFAGAKTAARFRHAFCDLLSRGRSSSVLQQEWTTLLPMLDDKRWELTRDLALLALPSYVGKQRSSDDSPELELKTPEPDTTE